MKITLITFCFLFSAMLSGQTSFESGYIIDDNGNRTDCMIKNSDWLNNPDEIEYKTLDDAKTIKKLNTSTVKEFGIGNNIVFKRFTVPVDMSSNSMVNMSNKKEPEFETRTLFLRQLVKGNANLYSYEGKNILRFFYNLGDSTGIKPLIYKKYKVNTTQVGVNAEFRNTLFSNLKCEQLTASNFKKLSYHKSDLTSIFFKYNTCDGAESVVYEKNRDNNGVFNIKVKGGIVGNRAVTKQELRSPNANTTTKGEISRKLNVRIGVEGEYIFPFNNGKWSIFFEPSYQSYDNSGEISRTGTGGVVAFINEIRLKYSFIELPLGVRHYMFLDNRSKLFINAGFAKSIDLDGTVFFEFSQNRKVNSIGNFFSGIGYDYNGKYSIELRVAFNRNVTQGDSFVRTEFTGIGLIMGYTFF